MEKLRSMLKLQQQLNDDTNGKGWENGITKNGKRIDWRRCIWLEAAELIESYPWKHWKNIDAETDYENISIEAVDIWHFVMSEALRINSIENDGDIELLAQKLTALPEYMEFAAGKTAKHKDIYDEMRTVESFVEALFCNPTIEKICGRFFAVAHLAGLDTNTLYALYTGKNILNRFRQDHGYKSGEYIKEWNGREDNEVLQKIMRENPDISPDKLYSALSDAYPANNQGDMQ
jgi:dimeric dUTPase (all-alpha-NTP-PPase superfamily)